MSKGGYPDFLLVGAARAGTTAVDRYLRQHPEVFLPRVKEPCFFAFAGGTTGYRKGKFSFAVTDREAYQALYKERKSGQMAGDLSTPYLFLYRQTIDNILRNHPDPKRLRIIALLRQPVDRAYSQYRWRLRDGREELSFPDAVAAEPIRKREGYSFDYLYLERSYYAAALQAYRDQFPQVHIAFYDDLRKDPLSVMQGLCRFLGVDPELPFQAIGEVNGTWSPRYPWLSRLVTFEHPLKYRLLNRIPGHWRDSIRAGFTKINAVKQAEEQLDPVYHRRLTERFTEDILAVQSMTGRNLASWLQ
ncbi:MAG: sulfotransferase [Bacteroidia bacterium]|nr:sulfotransferase [Bacteroidia bacterium]MBP7771716.1 sulfotransferase [Bacteroidia bacterium]